MFEMITNTEDRGQVGIGTLIVFIAMVLVAAIAAGVLINTAGFLQTQAEATGQDSTDLVSERIDVTSEVGIVEDSSNPSSLTEIRLTVSGAPGAGDIDLTDTTIQAVGPGGQENIIFVPGYDTAVDPASVSGNEIDVPAEIDESAEEITVAEGGVDSGFVIEVDDGSNTDEFVEGADFASGDGEITLSFSNVDPSNGDLTVSLLDGTNGNVMNSQEFTTRVGAADDTVDDSVTGNEIDSPAEIEKDAGEITIAHGSLTDGSEIQITDGEGNTDTFVSQTGGSGDFDGSSSGESTLSFSNVDPSNGDLTVSLIDTSGNPVSGQASSVTVVEAVPDVGSLSKTQFAVSQDSNLQTGAVLGDQEQYTIVLNPSVGAFNDGTFGEGDSATLKIVSPAGSTTTVELRAPDLFSEGGEAVRL